MVGCSSPGGDAPPGDVSRAAAGRDGARLAWEAAELVVRAGRAAAAVPDEESLCRELEQSLERVCANLGIGWAPYRLGTPSRPDRHRQ